VGIGSLLTEATKPGPCQVRSKTESPCLKPAMVQIRGIPFCEACAREQEAYFVIGELTQEDTEGLRSEALGEALGRMRRDRAGSGEGIAA
jgi:FXSXX-COOH protein